MDRPDPTTLCQLIEQTAKGWWAISLVSRCAAILLGAIGAPLMMAPETLALFVLALSIITECASYKQDDFRSRAQGLRRKLEYADGLGWPPPASYMSDLVARLPPHFLNAQPKSATQSYFGSRQPTGPARLLENLSESAWFSKHLSETMAWWCSVLAAAAVMAAAAALYMVATSAPSGEIATSVARLVSGFLTALLSLGVVRLAAGYWSFSSHAARLESTAVELLRRPDEREAIMALHEYQLARATAPILPDWLWRLKRTSLAGLWDIYRRQ